MRQGKNNIQDIIIRYIILVLVAIPNLIIFYIIFRPLTIYPSHWLLNIFFEAALSGNTITISEAFVIKLIDACIAAGAYYLLLILNLATPNIATTRRLKIILTSFAVLLVLNILRIFVLSLMFISGSNYFQVTHLTFWYALSTIFVIGIWFAHVKLYEIKGVPFYSDLKFIYNKSTFKKSKNKK